MNRVEPNDYYCDYCCLIGNGAIPPWAYEWREGVLHLDENLEIICQKAWKLAETTRYAINPVEAYCALVSGRR